jgi:hypothetical protein
VLQELVEGMGSVFNLDLARLFISKRFIVWEGPDSDRMILSKFQSILYPKALTTISSFPKTYVEGWGGWQRAVAIAGVFNHNQVHVHCYCLFDSDYHTPEDIETRKQDAINRHVNLHIWARKEIENYVIEPVVLCRYIEAKKRKGIISLDMVYNKLKEIEDELKDTVLDGLGSEIEKNNNKLDFATVRQKVSTRMEELWKKPLNIVPGKELLKRLSAWTSKEYGIRIQALSVIPYFKPAEVPDEIKKVIAMIMNGGTLT